MWDPGALYSVAKGEGCGILEPRTLLLKDAAAMQSRRELLQKVKNRITLCASIPTVGINSKELATEY